MTRFEIVSLRCKTCDWQWEITSEEKTENMVCNQCGSSDIVFEKKKLQMIKKGGKFLTEIGYASENDKFNIFSDEETSKQLQKPVLIIKEDDWKFTHEMTVEEKRELLEQMENIKHKLIRDVIDDEE